VPGRAKTYGFVNAKIRSKLGELLTDKDFTALMKKGTLEEAVEALLSTVYREEVSRYMRTGDVRTVEFALYVHEIETVRAVQRDLMGEAAAFAEALLLRYETDMVKNALRLWFDRSIRGRNITGDTEYLYLDQLIHPIDLTAMVNASDDEALLAPLEGTPYRELIAPALSEVKEQGHLFPAELALDGYFYRSLLERAGKLPERDRSRALRIIEVEIDIQNIDRVARFVSFFEEQERQEWDIFLPGGSIPREVLREAYRKRDVEEALTVILSRSYSGYKQLAGGHKSNPYERLQTVEHLLYTILHDEVDRLLRGYPFTIGTVLAYVFLKRREIGAVIRILNAKWYGFSEEAIREFL
jgi:V/A-type H+-transporting ATPase subunit C